MKLTVVHLAVSKDRKHCRYCGGEYKWRTINGVLLNICYDCRQKIKRAQQEREAEQLGLKRL